MDVAQCPHLGNGRRTGRQRTPTVKRRHGAQRPGLEAEEEAEFKQPIADKYEQQGHPYFASARLWDDGVIDPAQTGEVALSLSTTLNRPARPTRFGVFRM